jgi:MarR family transcriptional regulator for hemolysin
MVRLSPETLLTSTLVRLARLYRSRIDDVLGGLGLSDALALTVVVLGRHPDGIRQNALAYEVGLEGPSLVRLLDRLVEMGLAERREDAEDRRAKTVHLTETGRAHCENASRALDLYRASLMEGIAADDIQAALRVFGALESRLLAQRREAKP